MANRKRSRAINVFVDARLDKQIEFIKKTVGLGNFIESKISEVKIPEPWLDAFENLAKRQ